MPQPNRGLARLSIIGAMLIAYSGAHAQTVPDQTAPAPSAPAPSAPAPQQLWLATGFATYHFDSDVILNGRNPGIGLEYRFAEKMAITAGRFYNSDNDHTRYLGLYYQPWVYKRVRFGAVVGMFDGYPKMKEGAWFPALIPAISYEYKRLGLNLAVVPGYKDRLHGGISVQLKFKLWDKAPASR